MADILVVKINMLCRNKELKHLHEYISNAIKTGVVILPPYCDAQVIPDDVEIRIEDMLGNTIKETN